jgi:(S)-2-hydroxy-acid oxidase
MNGSDGVEYFGQLTDPSLLIRPRVMVDVSNLDTKIQLFDRQYPFPIAFAPSAMQKLAHPQGEESVALAAHKLGINMTLSSQSTTSLEDIAELMPTTSDGPERWFQLYMSENPELSIPLIKRAAGKPLGLTKISRTCANFMQMLAIQL